MKLFVRFQTNSSLQACEANSEGKEYDGHAEKDVIVSLDSFSEVEGGILMLNNLGVWINDPDGSCCMRAKEINSLGEFNKMGFK